MRKLVMLIVTSAFAVVIQSETSAQSKRTIHIEVSATARADVQTQQNWMEVLAEVGADRVRSRTTQSTGTIEIKETETSLGVLVNLYGVIDGNMLKLPGQSFQLRDVDKIRDYVQKLRDDGADVALADKKAFGLTSEQLVSLNEAFSIPVEIETKNRPAQDVLDFAERKLNYEIELDAASKLGFKRAEPFQDELQGLSLGTALAAAIRPLGLVLAPARQQGAPLMIRIVDSRSVEEHWPIGWPAPQNPIETVPRLFEKNVLEIRDFPLDQVLAAVQTKADVPMLFDYNSLARAAIDLTATNVTFVNENSSYGFALRQMLNQTRPRTAYEIRVDESGKPFLWISTANPVK